MEPFHLTLHLRGSYVRFPRLFLADRNSPTTRLEDSNILIRKQLPRGIAIIHLLSSSFNSRSSFISFLSSGKLYHGCLSFHNCFKSVPYRPVGEQHPPKKAVTIQVNSKSIGNPPIQKAIILASTQNKRLFYISQVGSARFQNGEQPEHMGKVTSCEPFVIISLVPFLSLCPDGRRCRSRNTVAAQLRKRKNQLEVGIFPSLFKELSKMPW